jgi:hypothetical protein
MLAMRVINPVFRPTGRTKPMRAVRVKLSPIATDMMTSFGARSAGVSAMLFVFLIGRVVIDAAEKSVIAGKKLNNSKDNSDFESDDYDSDE